MEDMMSFLPAKAASADAVDLVHVVFVLKRQDVGMHRVRFDRDHHPVSRPAPTGAMIDLVLGRLLPDLAVRQCNRESAILVEDIGLHRYVVNDGLGVAEQATKYADTLGHGRRTRGPDRGWRRRHGRKLRRRSGHW